MKAYELIADALAQEGADVVFALLGDGNMLALAALVERHGARLVNVRHENAAVAAADGWARVSGRVGVASVTCGPGLTQVATALTAAVRNRTPLVLFAGDVPVGMAWNPQRIDQGHVTAVTGARFIGVGTTSLLAPSIAEAFTVAARDRVPVVVSVPYDLQELRGRRRADRAQRRLASAAAGRAVGDRGVARPPRCWPERSGRSILAGRGAVESGAREAILALAERTGALLGTTLLARDWFRGEPFDVGLVGGLSSRTTRELVAEADVVLAVGAGLGYFATDNGALLRGKNVIQVDLDPPGSSEGVRAATSFVRGDAALAVAAIDAALGGHRPPASARDETAARLANPLPEYPEIAPEPGTVDPAAAMQALDAALPDDALLVYGVGHFWSFAVMHLHRPEPGRPPSRLRLRRRRPRPPDGDRSGDRREPAGRAGRGRRQPAHARRRALDRREGEPEPARAS